MEIFKDKQLASYFNICYVAAFNVLILALSGQAVLDLICQESRGAQDTVGALGLGCGDMEGSVSSDMEGLGCGDMVGLSSSDMGLGCSDMEGSVSSEWRVWAVGTWRVGQQ